MTSQTLRVTKRQFTEKIQGTDHPILIIFKASWSDKSQAMASEIKDIVEEQRDGIETIELDVDDNDRLANEYSVSGLPAFYLHYNDNLMTQCIGPDSIEEVQKKLEVLDRYD